MVRTVERIEQELAALDRSLETIAEEFRDTYRQYLTALGQSVKQQLILAAYHLCTQGYPERFLNLSLNQRQTLQQSLRQLAQQSQQQFLEMLNASQWVEEEPSRRSVASATALFELSQIALSESRINENGDIEFLGAELSDEDLAEIDLSEMGLSSVHSPEPGGDRSSSEPDPSSQADPSTSDLPTSDPQSSDTHESDAPTVAELLQESVPSSPESAEQTEHSSQPEPIQPEAPSPPEAQSPHPRHLARWQERLEEKIVEELQNLSHSVNRLLQQSDILPARLPEPVLEVAARADLATEASASPPNLLNLVIETETEEPKESTMTQLMAVRLRLSEIEFSDSSTMIWRSKVRELLAKLNKLGREYQKKQKERSIAQAEAAWRSSWYEEKE